MFYAFLQEFCDFYVSEAEWNSSDLILTRCNLDSLIYDATVTSSSIVTSFQLSCHRQWIRTCIEILHQVAIILGTLAFGLLADWIGRSKALIFGLVFLAYFPHEKFLIFKFFIPRFSLRNKQAYFWPSWWSFSQKDLDRISLFCFSQKFLSRVSLLSSQSQTTRSGLVTFGLLLVLTSDG